MGRGGYLLVQMIPTCLHGALGGGGGGQHPVSSREHSHELNADGELSDPGHLHFILEHPVSARNRTRVACVGDANTLAKSYSNSVIFLLFRIAKEHQKTPQEVVKMENFHHLVAELSSLKIPVLDQFRRDAKQK